jgi:cell division protein FtsN
MDGMTLANQRGNTLVGIFVGLVIGVLLSFGVVWYMSKTPLPFRDKAAHVDRPMEESSPAQLPGKPGDKVGDKPRFEFFKILPNSQEPVPMAPTPTPAPVRPAASAAPLFLQAGSFQNAAEADDLKARLALMGIEAMVIETDIPGKGKMHRVRIGPIKSADEMNRVRGLLSQNGIQAAPARGN